ncbi:MAG: gluconate 2-dehydrogenase subunit 3 family protein [Acidobacteria bacterium]|nr:gluconate 2-dehydrogenase subunit 3 family protein [Acidobacteriota bacterium]MBI3281440.1 gluconate 2-dehydrogenase subunit 3 family protein [Acidobacteriota bacterium]
MSDRREALKIIGAIGTTCAFPYSADELYGQHHPAPAGQALTGGPRYFPAEDFAVVSRIADLIIPRTDTPGAQDAGVPAYIDYVVGRSPEQQEVFRRGLRWLRTVARDFLQLSEEQQTAILRPLSDAVDRQQAHSTGERFFRAIKSLTADGYYTSRAGLVEELGFNGGSVLASFPECTIEEH